MKTPTLLTLTLLAAATVSAQSNPGKSGLSYDRVSVGYASGGDVNTFGVSGSALLGENILIGGNYLKSDFTKLGTVTGTSTGFELGYKLPAGDGDLLFHVGYAQLQASGMIGSTAMSGSADQLGYGIAWRQKLNGAVDYTFAYSHARTNNSVGGYDLVTGVVAAAGSTSNEDTLALALRYSFTKSLDVTLGYDYSLGGGENFWSISLGCSF